MELNPQFVIDFLQNDPGLDDTSLNLLLPDARGDPQYSNLSQTTPSLDYEITTDVLPSIMQPEQRTSTPTPTEPSSTITTFLNNSKAVSIMFRRKEYCLCLSIRTAYLSRQKESSGLGLSIVRAAGKHGR